MTPEGRVKKEIKDGLARIRAHVPVYEFWPVQMGYGARTVDLLLCFRGRFFAFEVKANSLSPMTANQKLVLKQVIEAGGGAARVSSWEEVRSKLKAWCNKSETWIDAL